MKEQLLHILDQSVCLSRKQMREYLSSTMLPEEVHAVEVHLNSCPLCRLALEGFEEHSEEALQAIASLNSGFLKEHFDNISPQIHLNSMAPAASFSASHTDRKRSLAPFWRLTSIAAGLLLLFGLVWALGHRQPAEIVPPTLLNKSTPNQGALKHKSPAHIQNAIPAPQPINSQAASAVVIHKNDEYVDAGNAVKMLPPEKEVSKSIDAVKPKSQADIPDANKPKEQASENASGTHYYQEYESKDEHAESPASTTAIEASKPELNRNTASYSQASVEKALASYLQSMKSSDPIIRYQSMILAAQCYDALGNRTRAQELLQIVINEAPGHERRAARRALRRLP